MTKKKESEEQNSLVGKVIDGYRVIKLKGAGAFAKVYDVRDDDLPDSPVAMQVAQPGCEALLEESKGLLNKLHGGPGIPDVFRYEPADEQGPARLFMSYFKKSVKDMMDHKTEVHTHAQKRLYWDQAARIAIQVLRSLGYVHNKEETHRDVKPSNVMTNDEKNFYLIDFNLADKVVEEARKKQKGKKKGSVIFSGGLNLSGDVLSIGNIDLSCAGGTPGYMSPEQQTRRSSEVGKQSDIYNVGAMLYHMATGELALGRFPKASELNDEVPEWGDMVLDKFLAKKVKNRYQNVREAIFDLERGLAGGFDRQEEAVPKKKWTEGLYKGLWTVGKSLGIGAWTAAKYTVGLPLTLGFKCFSKANHRWTFRDESISWKCGGVSIISAGISLYATLVSIGMDNWNESKLRDELKNAGLRGRIASAEGGTVHYLEANRALDDDKGTIKIHTGLEEITSLIWSSDGKGFYLIGKREAVNGKDKKVEITSLYKMDLEGKMKVVKNLLKEGVLGDPAKIRLINCTSEGDIDNLLIRHEDGTIYSCKTDDKSFPRKVVRVTPGLLTPQTLSPDGKYKVGIDPTNDVEIVRAEGEGDIDILYNKDCDIPFRSPAWYFERIAEAKKKIEEEKAEKKLESEKKSPDLIKTR